MKPIEIINEFVYFTSDFMMHFDDILAKIYVINRVYVIRKI